VLPHSRMRLDGAVMLRSDLVSRILEGYSIGAAKSRLLCARFSQRKTANASAKPSVSQSETFVCATSPMQHPHLHEFAGNQAPTTRIREISVRSNYETQYPGTLDPRGTLPPSIVFSCGGCDAIHRAPERSKKTVGAVCTALCKPF
jgi:hypothetical protein